RPGAADARTSRDALSREALLRLLRKRSTRFPVSSAQRRLWVVHQSAPDSARYGMPIALDLRGRLDIPALQTALTALARPHDALRTTLDEPDDGPVQVVHPVPAVPLCARSGRPTGDDLRAELARPFDLRHGPLIRTTVWSAGPDEHVLMLTLHHIVADAWSL